MSEHETYDVLGPLTAYRVWMFKGPFSQGLLRSTTQDFVWRSGLIQGQCFMMLVPHPKHQCGLYTLKKPEFWRTLQHRGPTLKGTEEDWLQKNRIFIFGEVKVSGRYIPYEHGYRSQKARITKIFWDPNRCSYHTLELEDALVKNYPEVELAPFPVDIELVDPTHGRQAQTLKKSFDDLKAAWDEVTRLVAELGGIAGAASKEFTELTKKLEADKKASMGLWPYHSSSPAGSNRYRDIYGSNVKMWDPVKWSDLGRRYGRRDKL